MAAFIHGVVLLGTYAMLWFLTLFCLIPMSFGAGKDPETGAPLSPQLGRKALTATAIATVLWAVIYVLIRMKVLDL